MLTIVRCKRLAAVVVAVVVAAAAAVQPNRQSNQEVLPEEVEAGLEAKEVELSTKAVEQKGSCAFVRRGG